MQAARNVLVAIVAIEHLWLLVLEMFLWTKPIGLRTFRMTAQRADASKTLAANQGLYNGFLAAGLAWGLLADPVHSWSIITFFLSCVIAAGVFGGLTASRGILAVQALPAVVALLLHLAVR